MKQTALITGASSGIGYELAKIMAGKGYDLVLIARNTKPLEEIAHSFKGKVSVLVMAKDLSGENAPQEVFEELQKKNIAVDILVNNAGFGDFGKFAETDWKKEKMMIDLNVRSLTEMTKLFLPAMVKRKSGRIMNLASTASFQPGPLMSVYYATKAYVLFFTEGIAEELRGSGVTVTALCPGPTRSGFQAASALENSKLVKDRKLPTAKEVAEYGYKAMVRGKVVAIHGLMNRLMAQSPRFTPRALVRKVVMRLQDAG
ncbi:MAG TPA: SDR family oxidoreductase [Bacteroidia bacterium]|jgi:short-subunit dehydrogenase